MWPHAGIAVLSCWLVIDMAKLLMCGRWAVLSGSLLTGSLCFPGKIRWISCILLGKVWVSFLISKFKY